MRHLLAAEAMLSSLLLTLALGLAATQGLAISQEPLDALIQAETSAYQQWAEDRPEQAMRTLAKAIHRAAAIATPPPSLAEELEFSLVLYRRYSIELSNQLLRRELLKDVEISSEYGPAHARLAWMRADAAKQLGMLQNWQLVGPFDNERGAGMTMALPPESSPDADRRYDGKLREVGWRSLPEEPCKEGVLRLDPLLDPSTQTAVLARTWVQSAAEQNVLLYLGFSNEIRVWVNGQPVLDAFGVHDFRHDSFVVPIQLKSGWNELAIKLGSRTRSAQWAARLAAAGTGTPLHLPEQNQAPLGVAPHQLSSAAAPAYDLASPSHAHVPGLRFRLARAQETNQARIWFRRSVLQETDLPVARHMHPGRAEAAKAVELANQEVRYHLQHARTLSQHNQIAAEKDVNPWLAALDSALALDPGNPRALRNRARHAWLNQPTYWRALELLNRAAQRSGESLLSRSMRIEVLRRMSEDSLATNRTRELLKDPAIRDYPKIMLKGLNSLSSAEQNIEDYRYILSTNYFPNAIDRFSEMAQRQDPQVDPIQIRIEEHRRWSSWGLRWRGDIAGSLLALGRADEALPMLQEGLKLSPESAPMHKYLARALWMLGKKEQAIAALEEELRLDFNAEDERRLLQHLLDQGAAPFHQEFQEPLADVISRAEDVLTQSSEEHSDSVLESTSYETLLKRIVIEVHPDGTAHRYYRLVRRVLNESGTRDLDRVGFYGAPGEQEVRILTADVLHEDGSITAARTSRGGRYGSTGVDLPPLVPGDIIDLEYRLDDLRPTFFGSYFALDETFADKVSVPTLQSEIVLLVPNEFPLTIHERFFNGDFTSQPFAENKVLHRWQMRGLQPVRIEAGMPPSSEFSAAIQASSYQNWEEFASWYWDLIKNEIRPSAEIKSKVKELTYGLGTPKEKLTAIYNFIVTDIRYNAWEFGVHGYLPYSAPVIFSRGFGDCKDKAILLRTMLSEVGIEAYPVLIRSSRRRFREDLSLAMVSHFNHCIAFIPKQDGLSEQFIDGTARLHRVDILPDSDQGAEVLVVKPKDSERKTIPFADASQNLVQHQIDIHLENIGEPQIRYTRIVSGRFDAATRHRFTGSLQERLEEAETLITSLFGPLKSELIVESWPDFEDLAEQLSITFIAKPAHIGRIGDQGLELPVSFTKLALLQRMGSEQSRKSDLLMGSPWAREVTLNFHLPPGASTVSVRNVSLDSPQLGYSFQSSIQTGIITIQERFSMRTHRIKPSSYASFRQACREVDETQNQFLQVDLQP